MYEAPIKEKTKAKVSGVFMEGGNKELEGVIKNARSCSIEAKKMVLGLINSINTANKVYKDME
jgi:hypothetical protein